jgi:hypothetical protein
MVAGQDVMHAILNLMGGSSGGNDGDNNGGNDTTT